MFPLSMFLVKDCITVGFVSPKNHFIQYSAFLVTLFFFQFFFIVGAKKRRINIWDFWPIEIYENKIYPDDRNCKFYLESAYLSFLYSWEKKNRNKKDVFLFVMFSFNFVLKKRKKYFTRECYPLRRTLLQAYIIESVITGVLYLNFV